MKISDINPHIRVAMHSALREDHCINMRVIYDYELIYIESGDVEIIYADNMHHFKEGDVIFLCPGIPHSFRAGTNGVSQPHIHFDITHRVESEKIPVSFKNTEKMTAEEINWIHRNYFPSYQSEPTVFFKDKEKFLEAFYNVIDCHNASDNLLAKGYLTQLISMLIHDNFPNFFEIQERYTIARQIKEYIDSGQGLKMNLEDFSKQFSYSKYYIEKKFKENFGIGVIEYRNNKRMQVAVDLLKSLSVSSVAEELGYQSIYSFSRAYKLYYGSSPIYHKSKKK